jgi:nucleoside-diphosphate-sugar epimerase
VIGKTSFIGKELAALKDYDIVAYKNVHHVDFSQYECVFNCALNPAFKTQSYTDDIDVDYEMAKLAYENGCHYIMLSTRRVYGSSSELKSYNEESPTNPFDFYSENKLICENKIRSQFGDKSVVVRGSNLYGFEPNRQSFMGFCMDQLTTTGKIVFSINETTKRDFIDIETSCHLLGRIADKKLTGLYNLSSNYGLEIGKVAKYLINGYRLGEFICTSDVVKEQFIIDNTKLSKELNLYTDSSNIQNIIEDLGEQLARYDY